MGQDLYRTFNFKSNRTPHFVEFSIRDKKQAFLYGVMTYSFIFSNFLNTIKILNKTGRTCFQFSVLIRASEEYTFAILIIFYSKIMWQKFIFQKLRLIPGTKNRIFRYVLKLELYRVFTKLVNSVFRQVRIKYCLYPILVP